MQTSFFASASVFISSISATVTPTGFSTRTCLPGVQGELRVLQVRFQVGQHEDRVDVRVGDQGLGRLEVLAPELGGPLLGPVLRRGSTGRRASPPDSCLTALSCRMEMSPAPMNPMPTVSLAMPNSARGSGEYEPDRFGATAGVADSRRQNRPLPNAYPPSPLVCRAVGIISPCLIRPMIRPSNARTWLRTPTATLRGHERRDQPRSPGRLRPAGIRDPRRARPRRDGGRLQGAATVARTASSP